MTYKIYLLVLGLLVSSGMLVGNSLGLISIKEDKELYIAVLGGSATGLGLIKSKSHEEEEEENRRERNRQNSGFAAPRDVYDNNNDSSF